jgi:hypothetical protein
VREELLGPHAELVAGWSDDRVAALARAVGGNDPLVVDAAYSAAGRTGAPTVVLARTIKGDGLPAAGRSYNGGDFACQHVALAFVGKAGLIVAKVETGRFRHATGRTETRREGKSRRHRIIFGQV